MNYQEFQRHVSKAGLKIHELADLLKMNRSSISNYAKKGEVPAHLAVIAALLGEMKEKEIDFQQVISRIEFAAKSPRGAGHNKFGGNKQQSLELENRIQKNK